VQHGPARFSYPFIDNGDYVSVLIERDYHQLRTTWQPPRLGTTRDPETADAYQVAETPPAPWPANPALVVYTRTFARVPAAQTVYGTISLTKPAVSSFNATSVNMQAVTGGGTSTNLGANYEYISHAWDIVNNRVYGPNVAVTSTDAGSDHDVTWTGHGLAGTERIAIYASYSGGFAIGWLLFDPGYYSIVDVNTVRLTGWAASMVSASYAAEYLRDYVPGADRVGSKSVTTFYLPGVTPGISTPADIPLPAPLINDNEFIAEIVSTLTGYIDYDAQTIAPWRGPIYMLETTQIDMADV
jgi:hypothetical protein